MILFSYYTSEFRSFDLSFVFRLSVTQSGRMIPRNPGPWESLQTYPASHPRTLSVTLTPESPGFDQSQNQWHNLCNDCLTNTSEYYARMILQLCIKCYLCENKMCNIIFKLIINLSHCLCLYILFLLLNTKSFRIGHTILAVWLWTREWMKLCLAYFALGQLVNILFKIFIWNMYTRKHSFLGIKVSCFASLDSNTHEYLRNHDAG